MKLFDLIYYTHYYPVPFLKKLKRYRSLGRDQKE